MVSVPRNILKRFIEADEISNQAEEDLFDWFLSHDKAFLKRLKQARKRDIAGKTLTLQEVKSKWGIK